MADAEIEKAWTDSRLERADDISPHLAFVQGYEACRAERLDAFEARAIAEVDNVAHGASGFADAIREGIRAALRAARS